ncbi:MAG: LemA family protein [Thermodesulfovibrionales bacterium]|nr:LemA family protein [Thermodesulfovibrionales bacterium]
MSKKVVIIGLAIFLIVLLLGWGISQYNMAVALDEQVKSQWAQVENQLKRRYDLIPNLVETVRGYAKHEKEIFENIAQARTRYFQSQTPTDKIKSANEIETALSRLLLLQEAYPQLKANENFLKLQDSLEGTENRISVERKRYNDAVRKLNTYRRTVFGKIFSSLAGVTEASYYEVPEGEKEVPKVKF